ncbi:MAG: YaaR family protein [Treponema sp.]|nr:YaaR family protein [Treponema sp.]
MAKVDGTDPSLYMNPSAYTQVKDDKKQKSIRRGEKTEFSRLFDELRGKTADQLGPLQNLPVSEDSVNLLMDEVRDAGDRLKSRPLPEEIMRYKQAVRNFINYVVQNCYSKGYDAGIPNFLKPGFKGQRGTPAAMEGKGYTKISIIDKKLDDLAAMLLSSQVNQLQLVSRLEEIRGLLVDLLQ